MASFPAVQQQKEEILDETLTHRPHSTMETPRYSTTPFAQSTADLNDEAVCWKEASEAVCAGQARVGTAAWTTLD